MDINWSCVECAIKSQPTKTNQQHSVYLAVFNTCSVQSSYRLMPFAFRVIVSSLFRFHYAIICIKSVTTFCPIFWRLMYFCLTEVLFFGRNSRLWNWRKRFEECIGSVTWWSDKLVTYVCYILQFLFHPTFFFILHCVVSYHVHKAVHSVLLNSGPAAQFLCCFFDEMFCQLEWNFCGCLQTHYWGLYRNGLPMGVIPMQRYLFCRQYSNDTHQSSSTLCQTSANQLRA